MKANSTQILLAAALACALASTVTVLIGLLPGVAVTLISVA